MVKIENYGKNSSFKVFWKDFIPSQPPPVLTKNAWMVRIPFQYLEFIKLPYVAMKTIATSLNFLWSSEKNLFFSPSCKNLNFQWKTIPWRWHCSQNLMTNFSTAANSRFTILDWIFKICLKHRKPGPDFQVAMIKE